jgi:hypothetical protein
MKKSILSLTLLLVVASVTNAAPRFGLIAEQTKGAGVFVTDDMYNAQLTVGNTTSDLGSTELVSATKISIGGNYKIALDSVTALTAGVNFETLTGDKYNSVDLEDNSRIAISVGFERALSSNLILTTQADLFATQTIDEYDGTDDLETTTIFSNGRVGVAYLF